MSYTSGTNRASLDHLYLQPSLNSVYSPLPSLNPGLLPKPYIELGNDKKGIRAKLRDLDVEQVEKDSSSATPKGLLPPPSAAPVGKSLTKKEKKAVRFFSLLLY